MIMWLIMAYCIIVSTYLFTCPERLKPRLHWWLNSFQTLQCLSWVWSLDDHHFSLEMPPTWWSWGHEKLFLLWVSIMMSIYFFPRSPMHSFIPLIRLNLGNFFLKKKDRNKSTNGSERNGFICANTKNHSYQTNLCPKIKIQFFKYGAA